MTVAADQLPTPHLSARLFGARRIPAFTDETLFERAGVRIAFTGREGGVSEGPYASLNLGGHAGDDADRVACNRELLMEALGAKGMPFIVPSQVHGDRIVSVDDVSHDAVAAARRVAIDGADAVVVSVPDMAALLCFADCVSVIVASPTGRFAVVHAGWRGVAGAVAAKATQRMARADEDALGPCAARLYNVYVGPHIHAECFETGEDVHELFTSRFGSACALDDRHIDLLAALSVGLCEVGVDLGRIVDAGACTACSPDRYFSYRAAGGVCGRHGAVAFRRDGRARDVGGGEGGARCDRSKRVGEEAEWKA